MGILNGIESFGGSVAGYALPFIFVLTVVVFFHELGHFIVARWCGIAVKTFSVGFGPELLGFNDRKGTRWRLSLIPLGGYVKFLGDENEVGRPDREIINTLSPEERARTFAGKSVRRRAAVVAAGPIANFLLAMVIFTGVFTLYGRQEMTPRVDSVLPGSVAEKAGIQPGDVIVAIDGRKVDNFNDLQRIVTISAGEALQVTVSRAGGQLTMPVTPELKEISDSFGNKHRVGVLGIQRNIAATDRTVAKYPLPQAAGLAVSETWFVAERTISYLVGVVAGRESADQLGGPIRVAEVSAQVATIGFVALINLAAILSISIGLINLFPVPMLDGGHLLFFGLEALRGRPLSERAQDIGFRIGFVAVVMLMIFATWNDIIHLSSL
jgi:regulator of sigma E protease